MPALGTQDWGNPIWDKPVTVIVIQIPLADLIGAQLFSCPTIIDSKAGKDMSTEVAYLS